MNCFIKIFTSLLIASTFLVSCHRNPLKIDVSAITEEVKIIRFEQELKSLENTPTLEQLYSLRDKYPVFTDLYTDFIIRIGIIEDEDFEQHMHAFLNDTMIISLFKLVDERFNQFEPVKSELVKAFKHYRYYFPTLDLPEIYTCVSGFNESVFIAEDFIGISLDKYLGTNIAYYSLLGLPRYKQRKMIPEMIPTDILYAWAMSEFDIGENASTLLDHIIHEGKLLYFLEAMMPSAHDTILTGFTARQVEWCKNNERQMWTYLIEHELLFSNKQMDIVRYINDGPQTNGFPSESPARTGAWIGWQIIKRYMKRNKEVTLAQLMENRDFSNILNASVYMPID
jgi:hypothetical protein